MQKQQLKTLLENISNYQNGSHDYVELVTNHDVAIGNIQHDKQSELLRDIAVAKKVSPEIVPFFQVLYLLDKKPEMLLASDLKYLQRENEITYGISKIAEYGEDGVGVCNRLAAAEIVTPNNNIVKRYDVNPILMQLASQSIGDTQALINEIEGDKKREFEDSPLAQYYRTSYIPKPNNSDGELMDCDPTLTTKKKDEIPISDKKREDAPDLNARLQQVLLLQQQSWADKEIERKQQQREIER